eukprot:666094-Amphidinium_carterae.1
MSGLYLSTRTITRPVRVGAKHERKGHVKNYNGSGACAICDEKIAETEQDSNIYFAVFLLFTTNSIPSSKKQEHISEAFQCRNNT